MKRIIAATAVLAMMASPVLAHDYYRHRPYRHYDAPRYYAPPPVHNHYYAPPRRDYTAPLLGVIIGGVVLGAIWYDNLNRRCVNEQALDEYGRPLYDSEGRPLVRAVCR